MEPWRISFITELFENTQECVEVAERHYLQSLIGCSVMREMSEFQRKYRGLLDRDSKGLKKKILQFHALREEISEGMVALKRQSDDFCALSAHQLPTKVETITFEECKQIELPNYSRFLLSNDAVTFGPLSERWDKLKFGIEEQLVDILSVCSATSTSQRENDASESNLDVYEKDEVETNNEGLSTSTNNVQTREERQQHQAKANRKTRVLADTPIIISEAGPEGLQRNYRDSDPTSNKPTVAIRKKLGIAADRPMSQMSQQMLLSSAKMAERVRLH